MVRSVTRDWRLGRLWRLLTAACALIGLLAAGSGATPLLQSAQASTAAALGKGALPQATRVRTGEVGILAGAGYYLAVEKGYFVEQGLDVESIHFATTAEETRRWPPASWRSARAPTVPGCSTRSGAGWTSSSSPTTATPRSAGPGNALVVRGAAVEAGELRGVPDLRGRRAAIASISIGVISDVRAYLAQGGLTLSDLTLEQMAFPDMLPALSNGSVDAAIVVEPFLTLVQQTGVGTRWLYDYEVNPDHQVAAVLYGPAFVREQPEAARRWMVAYLRGVRDFNDGFVRGNSAAREESIQVLDEVDADPRPRAVRSDERARAETRMAHCGSTRCAPTRSCSCSSASRTAPSTSTRPSIRSTRATRARCWDPTDTARGILAGRITAGRSIRAPSRGSWGEAFGRGVADHVARLVLTACR